MTNTAVPRLLPPPSSLASPPRSSRALPNGQCGRATCAAARRRPRGRRHAPRTPARPVTPSPRAHAPAARPPTRPPARLHPPGQRTVVRSWALRPTLVHVASLGRRTRAWTAAGRRAARRASAGGVQGRAGRHGLCTARQLLRRHRPLTPTHGHRMSGALNSDKKKNEEEREGKNG